MIVVGSQTLDQLWVVKTVHQSNLIASCCPLFGSSDSAELSRKHLTRLLMGQPEHLAELPAGNMMQYSFSSLHKWVVNMV